MWELGRGDMGEGKSREAEGQKSGCREGQKSGRADIGKGGRAEGQKGGDRHCSIRLRTLQGFTDGSCFRTFGSESSNSQAIAKRNIGCFPGILRFTPPRRSAAPQQDPDRLRRAF